MLHEVTCVRCDGHGYTDDVNAPCPWCRTRGSLRIVEADEWDEPDDDDWSVVDDDPGAPRHYNNAPSGREDE